MEIDYINFKQRADRSDYIAKRFSRYLSGKVLDVGCDKAVLKGLLSDVSYTGIDISGTPDIVLNLEQIESLPFEDNIFTCTVCSDVLEHLNNLHHSFGELVRVTKDHMIISLPNNWTNARNPIERGKGSIAHYGLPPIPPPDRHKWFFGFTEAVSFLKEQEKLFPISLIQMIVNEKPRPFITRIWRRLKYPNRDRYFNRYAHTVWAVFVKKTSALI
jgi:SAM-dependent methyltransferase